MADKVLDAQLRDHLSHPFLDSSSQPESLVGCSGLEFPYCPDLKDILEPCELEEAEHSLSFEQSFFSPDDLLPPQQYSPQSQDLSGLHALGYNQQEEKLDDIDVLDASTLPEVWQEKGASFIEASAPAMAPSPFSSSTVQAATLPQIPRTPWLAEAAHAHLPDTGTEEFGSYTPGEPASCGQFLLLKTESGNQAPLVASAHSSGMLSYRSRQWDQAMARNQRAHSMTFGQRQESRTPSAATDTDLLRGVSLGPDPGTIRSASGPICSKDLIASDVPRPSKRHRKHAAIVISSSAGRPSYREARSSHSSSILLPMSARANSIRIVSGKGDFEFPAWKPHDEKPKQRMHCLTVRSNELGKVPKADSDSEREDGKYSRNSSESHKDDDLSKRSLSADSSLNTEVRPSCEVGGFGPHAAANLGARGYY